MPVKENVCTHGMTFFIASNACLLTRDAVPLSLLHVIDVTRIDEPRYLNTRQLVSLPVLRNLSGGKSFRPSPRDLKKEDALVSDARGLCVLRSYADTPALTPLT